jgi:GNAT superfamily N-acetyltransferase
MTMNYNPSEKETEQIRKSLFEFNAGKVGDDGHTPLNIVEYDSDGNLIGGILGGTYWGWMYVDILWVREDHRKKGIGSKLLSAAEKEAKSRGCHHVHLDTMSWQAPEFYKKHGYTVIGILPDIPSGNQKYLLMKEL